MQKDPLTLPPRTVRTEARSYAEKEVSKQKEEFRKLGVMADWENHDATYRTLGSQHFYIPGSSDADLHSHRPRV
jgi:isoleucyl-tRNA synthetase